MNILVASAISELSANGLLITSVVGLILLSGLIGMSKYDEVIHNHYSLSASALKLMQLGIFICVFAVLGVLVLKLIPILGHAI